MLYFWYTKFYKVLLFQVAVLLIVSPLALYGQSSFVNLQPGQTYQFVDPTTHQPVGSPYTAPTQTNSQSASQQSVVQNIYGNSNISSQFNNTQTFNGNSVVAPVGAGTGVYVPLAPISGFIDNRTASSLPDYLNNLFRLGVAVATGLAVIMIVIGGVEYLSTDAWTGKKAGLEKVYAALWGLVIALGSYALLNTINPQLLNTNLVIQPTVVTVTIPPIPQNPSGPIITDASGAPVTGNSTTASPIGSGEAVNQTVAGLEAAGITNPATIAAILGHVQQESDFNGLENDVTDTNGGAKGMFQVSDAVWNNYTVWAAENNYSASSQYAQAYYMAQNYYRVQPSTDWQALNGASNPSDALNAWGKWNYWGTTGSRFNYADQYYQNFQNTGTWGGGG